MDEEASPSATPLIPLALAVLGIFLGGAGLYFGFTASQRLTALEEAGTVAATEAARIAKSVEKASARLDEVAAESAAVQKAVDRFRAYNTQTEKGLKQVAAEVNANREQIVKTAKSLSELAASGPRPAPAATVAEGGSGAGAAPSPAPDGGKSYRIQSGDTFARVAAREGVSLQALLDANPGADPRRLAIGQEIVIPAP
jgi:LysM repeat protein